MASLAELGYQYVPGPSDALSEWVLRQCAAPDKGFEWQGQEHYDALGRAVLEHMKHQLVELCGLEVRVALLLSRRRHGMAPCVCLSR